MAKLYRQGDVLLERVKKQQAEFKPVASYVLRHGTATGHSHVASCPAGTLGITEIDGETYLRIADGDGVVSHEEHATIDLPPADYKVTIQEQYDPKGYRKVLD